MYNMDISIGSYKFRLEILLLIVIVSWIMFGHVICSCCTMSFQEGLETMNKTIEDIKPAIKKLSEEKEDDEDDEDENNDKLKKIGLSKSKEGFVGSNNSGYGPEFSSSKSPGYIMKPDKWAMPTLTYSKGTTPDAGVRSIWDRPKQPIPLPKGELDIFATTPFKPECCPNTFSSSEGCACMTTEQYGYLKNRGGNNVPYSEY
jgi:hypothetical protein